MSLYDRAVRRWKPLKNDITTVRRGLENKEIARKLCSGCNEWADAQRLGRMARTGSALCALSQR